MTAELQLDDVVATEATLRSIDDLLEALLDGQRRRWTLLPHGEELLGDLRSALVGSGKRLRPRFCHWGFVGARGEDWDDLTQAAAALELLHTFALVHDDVMDGSPTRRGGPSLQVALARRHRRHNWRGEERRHAEGMAVLVGDLAYTLAHRLVAGLSPIVIELWQQTCDELVLGQYLDMRGAAASEHALEYARAVIALKSARYTVVRPLLLGAAVAGGLEHVHDAYLAYGQPLGEAFQLRDDLLGVFGDPAVTGKPIGEDLREGKPTLLLALTVAGAPAAAAGLLERVGRPDLTERDVHRLRDLCVSTGARDEVQRRIRLSTSEARDAICVPSVSRRALPGLLAMVDAAACRDR